MIFSARSLAQARAKSTVAPKPSTVHTGSPAAICVPAGDRSTAQSGQSPRRANDDIVRGVDDFGRFESRSSQKLRVRCPSHAAIWRANSGTSFDSNTSSVAPGRGLISMSQTASSDTRKSALLSPTRSSSEAITATERAISSACAGSMSTGPAAPPYRNRRRRRWRGPLHAETNNFRFFFAREE